MVDEFSVEALHTLIEEIHDLVDSALKTENSISLNYINVGLFEKLHEQLNAHGVSIEIQTKIYQELASLLFDSNQSVHDLHIVVANCKKCVHANSKPIAPRGNISNPKALFILENPAKGLDRLKAILDEMGFDEQSYACSYLTRCQLREVTDTEVNNCQNYLFNEIDLLHPQLIIPVGALPTKILLNKDIRINEIHGKSIWLGIYQVVPIWSPIYVDKADITPAYIEDLNRVKSLYAA